MVELDARQRRQLEVDGYVMWEELLDAKAVRKIVETVERLYVQEGERAGAEFKQEIGARRLANLANKDDLFLNLIQQPDVLAAVRCVLGDEFKLSSVNARSANPQSQNPQPLHCDMGAIPDSQGYWVCNALWMLDAFTAENGTVRVVPGSHRWRKLPQDDLSDPHAAHPDEQLLIAPAGSVVVMNAHLWHGGTANQTTEPRRAVHAFYCRRDKPQQQYQKQLLDDAVLQRLTPELRHLLAIDDEQNDALSRDDVPRSGFLT